MPTVLVPITGSVLGWAMAEAGISAHDVAAKLGVDVGRVQDWISGAQKPNKTNFDKLQVLLDRPESFFFLPAPPASPRSTARFRSHAGRARPPTPADLRAIKLAENLQSVATWLADRAGRWPPPTAGRCGRSARRVACR